MPDLNVDHTAPIQNRNKFSDNHNPTVLTNVLANGQCDSIFSLENFNQLNHFDNP